MFDIENIRQSLLLIDRSNRKYFSGVNVEEGYLFWGAKKVYFADARYFYPLRQSLKNSQIECVLLENKDTLLDYIRKNNIKELFVDFDKVTYSEVLTLKKVVKKISDGKDFIFDKRAIKSSEELENIRKACEIALRSYKESIVKLKVGMSEIEFKEMLESKMMEYGAESTSFDTIVAFGANSAVPHHQAGQTVLQDDTPILVDMGCKVNGYCSDITRMAYMGMPDERFLECYQWVRKANELAEDNIYDGIVCVNADAIARDYLKEKGLDKYFTHSLGHGIGLDIHEFPSLSPKGKGNLQENMVFSIEPGVYFDGEFGIRIEDTVTIKNGKVKRLFNDEKNLIIL